MREMDSSAISAHKRAVMDMHRWTMMDTYESLQARAAMDAIRSMPDFSRTELNALKDLQVHQSRIFDQMQGVTPFLDTIREREQQIATMFRHDHVAMLDAIKAATQPRFDPLYESIKTFDRMNLAQLGSIAGSARLAALSFTNPALESAFSASSFASTIAESMRSALQATTVDASMFEGLEELIEEKVAELPHNKITAQGLYRIVIDILIVFLTVIQVGGTAYQIHDGTQRDAKQAKQQIETAVQQDKRNAELLRFLKQIAENTGKLVPENDTGKYYVVERQVTLRLKPKSKSGKIVILFPNQQVLLVQDKHEWIYIQYFDYLEGIPRYGWAMKKYLKRVD